MDCADCRDTKAVLTLVLKKSRWECSKPAVVREMSSPTSPFPGCVYIKSSLWWGRLGIFSWNDFSPNMQFYKQSEKLKRKQWLLHHTPQGLFLSWHGWPLPSSLPHDSMASPGFGDGRQLPACRQGGGMRKHPMPMGKPAPLLSSPHRDLAARQLCPPCNEFERWQQNQGCQPQHHGGPKVGQTGKGAVASCSPCTGAVPNGQLPRHVALWTGISCLCFVFLPLQRTSQK